MEHLFSDTKPQIPCMDIDYIAGACSRLYILFIR